MKLFSEKVEPTFTNSTFNILQVENYSEIFFDVYEIELNKIKYPAEKISSFRGNPVVSVPVVIGEKEQEFPFVLIKGSESIFFNESNIEVPIDDTPVEVEDTDVLFESVDIDHDHRIKEDTKREIMEHIENAKVNARKQAESIKREKLKEADTEIRNKNKLLRESLDTAKQQLVKEFISITKSIKRELINEADDKYSELTLTIDNKINDLANTLAESIQSDFENSSKELETNIRAFVKAIHNESVLPELRKSLETIATDAVVRIKGIESDLDKKLTEKVDVSVIEELTSELDALRNSNIELNNTLNKGVNKALSRVGNVNNRLDEAVADITKQVDDKISATADNISSYYSDKLQVLEDQTFELNEKSRQYVVDIVRESRDNLISEIRKIQKEAPVEFVIESAGKKKTKTFDSIQKDIDKKISDRVSDEVIKLRKYIAVYSGGGGTVAQQFADGGVMNGDLIVNGDIFSNGSQVAALVDPVKTTLNGNGILSSFPISGAEGLINPSALTVAIDGVLQEPIVDYTVSGGNITFSDPIPLGCKAVIISPVNSLQISQMIPADGSVTSSKLDNSLNLAGDLTVGGAITGALVVEDGFTSNGAEALFTGDNFTVDTTNTVDITAPTITLNATGGVALNGTVTASGAVSLSSFTGPSGLVEMKSGATWQKLRLYSTTDNATNYEYITVTESGANWRIGNNKSGTGPTRAIALVAQGSVQLGSNGGDGWSVNTSKHFLPDSTTNTRDLGQTTSRIRNLYVGTLIDCTGNLTVTGATTLGATTITSAGSFTIGDNATAILNATLSRNGAGVLLLNSTNAAGVNIYGQLQFSNDNAVDIGNVATNRPRNLYVGTGVFAANLTASGTITATGIATASNFKRGAGSPESVVTGIVGDIYTRTDGGAGTTLYVKESGTGNTGWAAK